MRLTFAKTLTRLAEKNPRIILLTGDLGFKLFDEFCARFGPRYVNVGVAEAQMMCAAAGLAHEGWRPITYSIASFTTARCFEQIKISIAYAGLPVVISGVGGGFAYGSSGVTHHSVDDLALMRTIPGITVVAPGDANEVEQLLPQVLESQGPCYFRIGRGNEPQYHAKDPAVLGRARLLRDGQDTAILSTGDMASEVLSAIKTLNSSNYFPIAYQFHTIKPLDTTVLEKLSKKVKQIITVEEHIPYGGLGCAVRDWLCTKDQNVPKLISLGPPDKFVLGSPTQCEIRPEHKFDAEAIVDAIVSRVEVLR